MTAQYPAAGGWPGHSPDPYASPSKLSPQQPLRAPQESRGRLGFLFQGNDLGVTQLWLLLGCLLESDRV